MSADQESVKVHRLPAICVLAPPDHVIGALGVTSRSSSKVQTCPWAIYTSHKVMYAMFFSSHTVDCLIICTGGGMMELQIT